MSATFPKRPRGGYRVLLIDPPWAYSNKRTRSAAAKNYPTMSLDQIAELPVGEIAAPDAALFLWTTWPFMDDAIGIGQEWGFEYKTAAFVWAKRNTVSNTPFFGMGNWTRANTEACLLFTRGTVRRASAAVPQFLWSPVLRHSEKPPIIRDRIVQLCGDVKRVELFSRHKVKGWDRFGNEVLT